MNKEFEVFIESLEPSFKRLMSMYPVTVATLPSDVPRAGIYLFSEGNEYLYVGRTNTLKKRLQNHCRPSSGHNSATFAFRITRHITGMLNATYSSKGSRAELEHDPAFSSVFLEQKQRVRNMELRFVSEAEPMRQALLEMYVAVSLRTPHNDFNNH